MSTASASSRLAAVAVAQMQDAAALGDEQVAHIGGQDCFDLIDLINHRPIKDGDSKSVSDFQLVEISKQLCAGKPAVR